MIVNPEKFQSIVCTKDKSLNVGIECKVGNKTIKTESSVKLLGVSIENDLKFNKHVDTICRKSSAQLNALFRIKDLLSDEAKKVLFHSFLMANFNYCPLVWHLTSSTSKHKIEMIHKRALRFLLDDFESSYEELLRMTNRVTMETTRLRLLCTEIFKTVNNVGPVFMKNIFQINDTKRIRRRNYENNLIVFSKHTTSFGTNSISSLGPSVWNTLPSHLKSCSKLIEFKKNIKCWDGIKCHCKICEGSG